MRPCDIGRVQRQPVQAYMEYHPTHFASFGQVAFKYADDVATVWCEYAEMELRNQNFRRAVELLRRATSAPPRARRLSPEEERAQPVQVTTGARCLGVHLAAFPYFPLLTLPQHHEHSLKGPLVFLAPCIEQRR